MFIRRASGKLTRACRHLYPPAQILHHRPISQRAYIEGPTEPPLLTQTIPQHFSSIVSAHGDKHAVISHHQHKILTYHDLDHQSNILARGLASSGVRKGDRFAVMLGNTIEFATVTYALFKLGAILVPLNPAFNTTQVISALNHLSAEHLMISTETFLPRKPGRSNLPMLRTLVPAGDKTTLRSEVVPSLRNLVVVNNRADTPFDIPIDIRSAIPYQALQHHGSNGNQAPDSSHLHPNDTINIQFTSGTTSSPKAAMLSHTNILNNGKSIGDRMLLTADDVVVCPPPLFHCFGCILGYMATATHGSAIIFPSESFDPHATLSAVKAHAGTALYGVPTMFLAELELLANKTVDRTGLDRLRTGIGAGSSIPAELMRKLHRDLNLTGLTICYGMTETSPVSAMTTTTDPIRKRIETVGKLLPHVRAKVVDPSDPSETLGVGERGELAVSGYLLMKGYYGDQKRTDEVLRPDETGTLWMHTGDEASIDSEGYVTITGRIKDLIIRGGENISPLEVESCLLGNPLVKEASVVGLPDERYGEVVAAFIVPRNPSKDFLTKTRDPPTNTKDIETLKKDSPSSPAPTSPSISSETQRKQTMAHDIRSWVKENLSHHLVPKYIFWVEDFPKTASGKIQKFVLREQGKRALEGGAEVW